MTIPKYTYGWLDKLTSLTLPDGGKAIHTYWPDGLLASISRSSQSPIPDPQSTIPFRILPLGRTSVKSMVKNFQPRISQIDTDKTFLLLKS